MPCPCIQIDEREIQNSVGTLVSLFTFLLLCFNVLLWCCFDFLDPGSSAKSNPYSQGHPTGRKVFSDSAPLSFSIPPSLGFRGITNQISSWTKAMEFLDFILRHIPNRCLNKWTGSCCFIKDCWVTLKTAQDWGRVLWDAGFCSPKLFIYTTVTSRSSWCGCHCKNCHTSRTKFRENFSFKWELCEFIFWPRDSSVPELRAPVSAHMKQPAASMNKFKLRFAFSLLTAR